MGKVNLKFKRLICFFIAIILLFCLDKNNYLHQVKADNETHEFIISPVDTTYTITKKFDNNTYDIPNNNYTLDLSNTSRNSPAEITEFIYQTKLKIEANTTNNATITKIEALDVNEKAVTITSSTDDNSYTLEFNSFFYDNVVFEITDSESEKYYLKINRYAAIISTNFDNIDDPTPTTKKVFANLYVDYNEDAGAEVINLETLVKKVYKDNSYDFSYASIEGDKDNPGYCLAITDSTNKYFACQFSTEVDSNVKEVYFITTRPQWTSKTNGIITGSGMGVKFDISTKQTTY